jgi:hypothetical protein
MELDQDHAHSQALGQDHVHSQALVITVLNLKVLLSEISSRSYSWKPSCFSMCSVDVIEGN